MNAAVRRYTLALPPRSIPFALSCLAFPLVMVVAGLAAENRQSLWPELLSCTAFIFVPLLIARFRFSDPGRAFNALCAYAPLGAAAGLAVGILQVLRSTEPASGGAGNPAVYGTAMTLLGAISLAGLFSVSRWSRAAAIAGFALGMAGLLLSESRTLYPMLVLLPLIVVVVAPSKKLLTLTAVALIFAGAIALLGGNILLTGYRVAIQDIERIASDDDHSGSIGVRAALWTASMEAFAQKPILGHGPQNKMDVVSKHVDGPISVSYNHVHNGLLDVAVAAGTAGMAVFVAVLLTPLLMVFGRAEEMRTRRYVALSTFAIFGLAHVTATPFEHDLLLVLFLLPLVIVGASDLDSRERVFWRGRKDASHAHADAQTQPAL